MEFHAVNRFHNKSCPIEVVRTYKSDFGVSVAVIEGDNLDKAAKYLCGIRGCECNSIHFIVNQKGKIYTYLTPDS